MTTNKASGRNSTSLVVLWMLIGTAVGVVAAAALDNRGLFPIGVAVGVAIGIAINATRSDRPGTEGDSQR